MNSRQQSPSFRPMRFLPLTVLGLAPGLAAQTTECVNLRPDGLATFAADATSCSMSADGRTVAFATASNVLVPGAFSGSAIYVRDRTTGTLTLASRNSSGQSADRAASDALISAQGRHVAFVSTATNLDPLSNGASSQVFVHDLQAGTTVLVSRGASGASASGACVATSISADGRYVAFDTVAALVPADTNGARDVYVRDLLASTTTRVSVDSTGGQSTLACSEGRLSSDGSRIAFLATGSDLVSGDSNGQPDVLVRDLVAGTTTLVSRSTAGVQSNSPALRIGISGDGNSIFWISRATTLDPTAGGGVPHVFARDLAAGTTRMLDVTAGGLAANGSADSQLTWQAPRSSHDGRHVVFSSVATNLVPGDTNNAPDVFRVDRTSGTIERTSLGPNGQQQDMDNGQVHSCGVSDDGTQVLFSSPAENLVAGDSSLSENNDVLVRDSTQPAVGSVLCTNADGAPCPCAGGSSYPVRGCRNGNEAAGLFASGNASLAADTLRIGVYELPLAQTRCILFQGSLPLAGNSGVAFGDGVRCLGGRLARLVDRGQTWAEGFYYPLVGDVRLSQLGNVTSPGTTAYYQVWYAAPSVSYCTPATYNYSNAIAITWRP